MHHEFILGEMYSTEYYRAEYRQLEVISYDSSGVAFPIEAPAGIRSGPLFPKRPSHAIIIGTPAIIAACERLAACMMVGCGMIVTLGGVHEVIMHLHPTGYLSASLALSSSPPSLSCPPPNGRLISVLSVTDRLSVLPIVLRPVVWPNWIVRPSLSPAPPSTPPRPPILPRLPPLPPPILVVSWLPPPKLLSPLFRASPPVPLPISSKMSFATMPVASTPCETSNDD